MRAGASFWLWTALLAALLSIPAQAQTDQSAPTDEPSEAAAGANEPLSTGPQAQVSTTRSVSERIKPLFMYGAAFVDGYSFPYNGADFGADFVVLHPYVSLNMQHRKFRLALTAAPTIGYNSDGLTTLGANGFLDPSVNLNLHITHRVTAFVASGIGYGGEASRLFGLDSAPCDVACESARHEEPGAGGTLPGGSVAAAVVHASTNTLFNVYGIAGMRWQATRRESVSISFEHDYSTPGNNISSSHVSLHYALSPHSTLGAYAQVHLYTSEHFDCTSYGTGVEFTQQISRRTSFGLSAGPEFGSSGCGQRVTGYVSGSLARKFSRDLSLYISATRDQDAYYVGGSRWVDSAAGGIVKRVRGSGWLQLRGTYVRSSLDQPAAPGYSGFIVSPQFRWRATRRVGAQVSYSHFHRFEGTGGGPPQPALDRDWVSLVLTWHGDPVRF